MQEEVLVESPMLKIQSGGRWGTKRFNSRDTKKTRELGNRVDCIRTINGGVGVVAPLAGSLALSGNGAMVIGVEGDWPSYNVGTSCLSPANQISTLAARYDITLAEGDWRTQVKTTVGKEINSIIDYTPLVSSRY